MGWIVLPQGLHLLANPVVLGVSGFMVFIEFFADKIPGLGLPVGCGAQRHSHPPPARLWRLAFLVLTMV